MEPIEPSLIAEILQEGMRQGQLPFLTVSSNSMAPLLQQGDQIQIEPAMPDQLAPGDIVVLLEPNQLFTHRFWGWSERGELLTRGDRSLQFDLPSAATQLVGRVIARRRRQQLLPLRRAMGGRLNRWLAGIAALENRLLGSHSSRRGKQPLWLIRLVRRPLYLWASLLTKAVTRLASRPLPER